MTTISSSISFAQSVILSMPKSYPKSLMLTVGLCSTVKGSTPAMSDSQILIEVIVHPYIPFEGPAPPGFDD